MSKRGSSRRPLRRALEDESSYWKMEFNVDENMDFDAPRGITRQQRPPRLAASAVPQPNQHPGGQALMTQLNAPIDVEASDDDVELLPSRMFPEGRNQSRRKCPVVVILDDDLECQVGRSGILSPDEPEIQVIVNNNNRVRHPPGRISVNSEAYGNYSNVECSHRSKKMCLRDSPVQQTAPKNPAFTCAICLEKMMEETSTNCGHIFCNGCIKTAIKTQKRCPTCRKHLTMKSIHRVYLPTAH